MLDHYSKRTGLSEPVPSVTDFYATLFFATLIGQSRAKEREFRNHAGARIAELQAGLDWMRERLEDRTPPDDVRRRARAFEALAQARLDPWSGMNAG